MAGAVALSSVGAGYQPYPHEREPYIVRKYLDNFHVCKRERLGRNRWYKIIADVATRELADLLVAALSPA